jgi:hypothetical protein
MVRLLLMIAFAASATRGAPIPTDKLDVATTLKYADVDTASKSIVDDKESLGASESRKTLSSTKAVPKADSTLTARYITPANKTSHGGRKLSPPSVVSGMGLAFTTDGNNVKMCSEHNGNYWSGGSWNNYGDQPTSEDCQKKCLDDPDCPFVLFRPANRFCTKYTACTRSPGIDWNWADDQVFRK